MNKENKEKGEGLGHFIKYNNAVPIALGLLFFATTGAFAASPEVRDAVYSSDIVVVTPDTSYLASVDLERYPFSMKVTGIVEDGDYYYVSYEFLTIDAVDAVWRNTTRIDTLRVSKALLRDGDLKAYVESELAQVRWHEKEMLAIRQQEVRREGATQKVVATVHTGLVGSLLKPTTEEIPQYHGEASPNDPLYVESPLPLVTWDENKKGSENLDAPDAQGGVTHMTGTIIIAPDGSVSSSTDTGVDEATSTEPVTPTENQPEEASPTEASSEGSASTTSL